MSSDEDKGIIPLKEECASFAQELEAKFIEIRGENYNHGFGWDQEHLATIIAVYFERFINSGFSGTASRFYPEDCNICQSSPEEDEKARENQLNFYTNLTKKFNDMARGDLPKGKDQQELFKDLAEHIPSMWK